VKKRGKEVSWQNKPDDVFEKMPKRGKTTLQNRREKMLNYGWGGGGGGKWTGEFSGNLGGQAETDIGAMVGGYVGRVVAKGGKEAGKRRV